MRVASRLLGQTLLVLCLAILETELRAEPVSFYQVGNSLTNDSAPGGNANLLAASIGSSVEFGFHIRSSSSISQIWNQPLNYTSVGSEFGNFLDALPANEWDHVALQSFPSDGNDLSDDVLAMSNFMALVESNPANGDTIFYVYAPWPRLVAYDTWEEGDASDDPSQPVRMRRAYYEALTDALVAERPGRVFMIPAGEVFFEVGQRIDAGELDGIESGLDLYRDHIHANGIGQFIAATTVAATVARANPTGWDPADDVPSLAPELALDLQEVIWDVLVDRKRSGVSPVGDLNIDTVLDGRDRQTWVERFGFRTELSADANGDDVVDQTDGDWALSATAPGAADIDGDGRATAADGAAWAAAYGGEGEADVNGDGLVDAADYSLWRNAAAIALATDFNGDGANDAADLAIWEAEQGWTARQTADANGDGVVDAADYTLWRDSLAAAATPLSTAVPEPTAFCLLAAALLTRASMRYSSAA